MKSSNLLRNAAQQLQQPIKVPAQKVKGYWDQLAKHYQSNASMVSNTPNIRHSGIDLLKYDKLPAGFMSTRDYIHTCLYHPTYGYFSQQADIFSPACIDFKAIKDHPAFMNHLSNLYSKMETGQNRQVWHTPTELFKPWYGNAIAQYIIQSCLKDGLDPILYEIGGGNGTLMTNILDYIQIHAPELYAKTRYHIIEIASPLALKQKSRLGHKNVQIYHQSILDWTRLEPNPCFVIAMEVIDNFSHDLIRFDNMTGQPLQGLVAVDELGDFKEAFEPLQDPLTLEFLKVRELAGLPGPSTSLTSKIRSRLPFAPALSPGQFLPTVSFSLLKTLQTCFPNHRLILSDFDSLPESVSGYKCAPVVQTRYKGEMVPCSTYLVQPGWFDIFFPTSFEDLGQVYKQVTKRDSTIVSQKDFVQKYGDVRQTTLKSGENPMLSFYENMKFILS